MADIAKMLNKQRDVRSFEQDPRFVLGDARIGVEFEFEGVRNKELPNVPESQFWEYHKEDSLKDNGAEFVFTQPLFGKDAYSAIVWMLKHAKDNEWKTSMRTGLHVHIDARDMEHSQLIGMIILYTLVEPVLFNWVGDNREENVHCVPYFKADDALMEAAGIIKSTNTDASRGTQSVLGRAEKFGRYAALNLKALADHGSIEFRHLKTTLDLNRLVTWINLIMSLKAAALKVPESTGAIVDMARQYGPTRFINFVFEGLGHHLLDEHTDALINNVGIPTAADLVLNGIENPFGWKVSQAPRGKNEGFAKFLQKVHTVDQESRGVSLAMQNGVLEFINNRPQSQRTRRMAPPQILYNPEGRVQDWAFIANDLN